MLYQLALNFIATVLIIFADSNSTDDRLVYTVQGCVWAYLFICTYSLKSKFRDEAKSQLGANDISMAWILNSRCFVKFTNYLNQALELEITWIYVECENNKIKVQEFQKKVQSFIFSCDGLQEVIDDADCFEFQWPSMHDSEVGYVIRISLR